MTKHRYIFGWIRVILIVALALASGCARKTVAPPPPVVEDQERAVIQEEELDAEAACRGRSRNQVTARARAYGPEGIAFESEDLYFEYDQYTLTLESQELLKKKAAFLRQHPEVVVTIEGHCDERGDSDYNLGLGERRAYSAKSYLINLGIAPNRLATVSYGEEQPVDPGHDEDAWARNRRVHLVIGGPEE
ncbi:MAG: peptidoglycan-associated lipoprotein Pal [Deltaproteobacteria bacterium]|nr:peptidoglycan-associated lipoprotein Pal [Deltaproteobacteria bacterium]MBW1986013.1 peptidoglycan-associated lipoprotein Pal [Deltaproteobacteria bacterium]MBW2134825.1 peptidoglycan-associated lipoprotein Pal [Deltaproteobacteria bacterium]